MFCLPLITCYQHPLRSYRAVKKALTPLLCRFQANTNIACTNVFCFLRILDGLNKVLDSYPLPAIPPLVLPQDTFVAVVDFNFNFDTFTGSSTSFHIGKISDSVSGSGLLEDDVTITSSASISSDLASILEGHQYPRIVFTIFTSEGLFLEREEYITENNRTTLVLGSTVIGAQLSEGLTVSDIEDVITLTFAKNEEVSSSDF